MDPTALPEIPIRHLDDDLVVVSKPAGMIVHRSRYLRRELALLQVVSAQLGRYLYPVHRLDRNTSGLLCLGLSSNAARQLHDNLADASAEKEYLVLVRGETPESFISDRPLTSAKGEPRPARSEFRRLTTVARCSLLSVRIRTGRQHQIRRHLNHLAHQVIGDTSYGKGRINAFFRETYDLPRMFVHAWRLLVQHPCRDETLELRDPLPDDLRGFLHRLPDVDEDLLATL